MKNENLDPYVKEIPPNIFSTGTLFGIPVRRWIEGLLFAVIIGALCYISPFVLRIKIILIAVLCTSVFTFSLMGIKNRSITEFFYDLLLFSRSKKRYHLASATDNRKENTAIVKFGTESKAELAFRIVRQKAKEFDDKYGQEEQ